MYNESQRITQQEFYSDFRQKSKGGLSRIPNEQFPHTVINIWWKFPKNQWSHHKMSSSLKNICHVQCTNSKERIRHSGCRYLDCKHLTTGIYLSFEFHLRKHSQHLNFMKNALQLGTTSRVPSRTIVELVARIFKFMYFSVSLKLQTFIVTSNYSKGTATANVLCDHFPWLNWVKELFFLVIRGVPAIG